jgi:hypothetical protein
MPRLKQTHCARGHEMSSENVYVAKSGHRYCKTCKNATRRNYLYRGRAVQNQRKHRYGVTPEKYDEMLESQDNKCKICRRPFGEDLKPVIDHDHATDKVRGLLCRFCNTGLGMFSDVAELLIRAVEYLKESQCQS